MEESRNEEERNFGAFEWEIILHYQYLLGELLLCKLIYFIANEIGIRATVNRKYEVMMVEGIGSYLGP